MSEVFLSPLRLRLQLLVLRGGASTSHDDVLLLGLGDVFRLEKVELDGGVDDEEGGPEDPPESDVSGQRLGHGVLAKLDADEKLGHNDGDKDPGLSAQLVTLRVIQQLEGLPQA